MMGFLIANYHQTFKSGELIITIQVDAKYRQTGRTGEYIITRYTMLNINPVGEPGSVTKDNPLDEAQIRRVRLIRG